MIKFGNRKSDKKMKIAYGFKRERAIIYSTRKTYAKNLDSEKGVKESVALINIQ